MTQIYKAVECDCAGGSGLGTGRGTSLNLDEIRLEPAEASIRNNTELHSRRFILSSRILPSLDFSYFDSLAFSLLEKRGPGSPMDHEKKDSSFRCLDATGHCQRNERNLAQMQPEAHVAARFNKFAKTAAPRDPDEMRQLLPLFAHSFEPAAAIDDPPAEEYQRQGQQDAPQQRKHKARAGIERKEQEPEHFPLHVYDFPTPAILARIGLYGS